MSELGSIQEFTESLRDDYFLARQGSGDVKISKRTLLQAVYPVGTVRLYSTKQNPNYTLSGTWIRIVETDAVLAAVSSASGAAGTSTGSNTVNVPLVQHTHAVSSFSEEGVHTHTASIVSSTYDEAEYDVYGAGTYLYNSFSATTGVSGEHSHTATVAATGTQNLTANVKQAGYNVMAWVRVK